MAKLSQGVTSVIVGNCGISAAPVQLTGAPPDPMNLLGEADAFRYPTFAEYAAGPWMRHNLQSTWAPWLDTPLCATNHMDRLDRAATGNEVRAMRARN